MEIWPRMERPGNVKVSSLLLCNIEIFVCCDCCMSVLITLCLYMYCLCRQSERPFVYIISMTVLIGCVSMLLFFMNRKAIKKVMRCENVLKVYLYPFFQIMFQNLRFCCEHRYQYGNS